jgi:ribosomal protein S20
MTTEGSTTMLTLRTAGLAGLLVATALVGGTIIGSVAAAPAKPATGSDAVPAAAASPDPARAAQDGEYCADFRTAFAAALGVDESALVPAAKGAAIATIDEAVTAGRLPQAVADRLKARIQAATGDGCALLAGRVNRIAAAVGRAAAGGALKAGLGVIRDGLTAAATALGVTPAELGADLRSGKTLKTVATEKSVPYDAVTAAVVGAVKKDLDAAVAAGTIKQARADRVLARLQQDLADGLLRPAAPTTSSGSPTPSSGG